MTTGNRYADDEIDHPAGGGSMETPLNQKIDGLSPQDAREWLAGLDFEEGATEVRRRDGVLVTRWRHPEDGRLATIDDDGRIAIRDTFWGTPGCAAHAIHVPDEDEAPPSNRHAPSDGDEDPWDGEEPPFLAGRA